MNCETPLEYLSVKPRRFKLEFYDDEGVRHAITIDGQVTREKVGKLLDLVEIMSGSPKATATALAISPHKFDRLASTIIVTLKGRDFTAADARRTFESAFSEKIQLSTVSTYLSRLVERGVLERNPSGRGVSYKVKSEEQRSLLSLHP